MDTKTPPIFLTEPTILRSEPSTTEQKKKAKKRKVKIPKGLEAKLNRVLGNKLATQKVLKERCEQGKLLSEIKLNEIRDRSGSSRSEGSITYSPSYEEHFYRKRYFYPVIKEELAYSIEVSKTLKQYRRVCPETYHTVDYETSNASYYFPPHSTADHQPLMIRPLRRLTSGSSKTIHHSVNYITGQSFAFLSHCQRQNHRFYELNSDLVRVKGSYDESEQALEAKRESYKGKIANINIKIRKSDEARNQGSTTWTEKKEHKYQTLLDRKNKLERELVADEKNVQEKLREYKKKRVAFHAEIRMMEKEANISMPFFGHRNWVKTYAQAGTGESSVMIQQLYEGDLYSYIVNTPLTYRQKLKLAKGMIKPLADLHEKGFAHGDLKLNNYVIERDGKKVRPALCDFGACRPQTKYGDFQGTLLYMSPQAPTVEKGINLQKEDLWSLGVSLYQLFNDGAFPYEGITVQSGIGELFGALLNMKTTPVPKPKDKKSIEYLIWRLLQINPKDRICAQKALELIRKIYNSC